MIESAHRLWGAAKEIAREPGDIAPPFPCAKIKTGLVWPPVAGRAILTELDFQTATPFRLSRGAWAATIGERWRLLSSERYTEFGEARADLLQWAKLHASAVAEKAISEGRCLVLNPEPNGCGRLWQVVPIHPSLRSDLDRIPRSAGVEEWTEAFVNAALALFDIPARLATAGLQLSTDLDRLGRNPHGGRPVFIAFVPSPRRLSMVAEPPEESVASNLDSILFELAFSRRSVLLGVAASFEGKVLAPPLSALRDAIRRALGA